MGKQVGADAQRVKHIVSDVQQQLRVLAVAVRAGVPPFIRAEFQQHCGRGRGRLESQSLPNERAALTSNTRKPQNVLSCIHL